MDRNVTIKSPADLYGFANGVWLDRTVIPADKTYVGTFQEIQDRNLAVLHSIAEKAAQQKYVSANSPEDLVGTFYRLAMDEAMLERQGGAPLTAQLKRIDRIRDRATLVDEIARLDSLSVQAGFSVGVASDAKDSSRMLLTFSQGGLNLPDRDLYLSPDSDNRGRAIRRQYVNTIATLMALAKIPDGQAQARDSFVFEKILARASKAPVDLRDPQTNYHLMGLVELKNLTPNVPWTNYFTRISAPTPEVVNVQQPKFLAAISDAIGQQSLAMWRSYLRARVLYAWAPYLSSAFENAHFQLAHALYGATNTAPRWRRAIMTIDSLVGDALSRLYVRQAFSSTAKDRAYNLVRSIKLALFARIGELDWMSEDTQNQARRKLQALTIKVGYPDKWKDYGGLKLHRGIYLECVLRATLFDWRLEMAKLGRQVDRSGWEVSAPTVNAYYNPTWNEVVFPAGILQPGLFDPLADDASNYGGIGAIIGREITRGFDDQGCQYDSQGNLKNWWTQDDKARFDAAATEIVNQYNSYKSPEGLDVNGQLTLGENIADIGGLTLSYLAYHSALGETTSPIRDGLTGDQRFFVAFAQNYKGHSRPEAARVAIATDSHSPDAVRVLGAVSDQEPFYKAFALKVPDHLPHLW